MSVDTAKSVDLSVVIPTLNEAEALPMLLADLAAQQGVALQVIVADGGSVDGSQAIAAEHGAILVTSPSGRGRQLNAGAKRADAELLLFLHADSRLPESDCLSKAIAAFAQAAQPNNPPASRPMAAVSPLAGHFSLRFIDRQPDSLGYRQLQTKTSLNRRNTTNGDQGMLLLASDFWALSGFDESLPFLEDQRFAEKLRERGQWITLPATIETSARRFETEGFQRRYTLMSLIMGMHAADMQRFFDDAPSLYRAQHETAVLQLAPFIALAWRVFWPARMGRKLALGRFVSSNAWQFALLLDVLLDKKLGLRAGEVQPRTPCLRFYDRYFAWFFDSRFAGLLTLPLLVVWFFGCLWPFYRAIGDKPNP